MDDPTPIMTLGIVVITAIVSFRAFTEPAITERLIFSPYAILARREYYRLATSALLHADGRHLFFNLISLYLFGRNLEPFIGGGHLLLIYLAAIIGGSLLSLYIHRHHEYRALGASGGVCGVIFASVFLLPSTIYMMPLPIGIPSWLYAILFLVGEFKGLRSAHSNIGHDAHIGGAIIGLLVTTALYPYIVTENPKLYTTVMGLSVAIFIYLWKNPLNLSWKNFIGSRTSRTEKKPAPKDTSADVDAVLEKISAKGLHSLTEKERQILKAAAKK